MLMFESGNEFLDEGIWLEICCCSMPSLLKLQLECLLSVASKNVVCVERKSVILWTIYLIFPYRTVESVLLGKK